MVLLMDIEPTKRSESNKFIPLDLFNKDLMALIYWRGQGT